MHCRMDWPAESHAATLWFLCRNNVTQHLSLFSRPVMLHACRCARVERIEHGLASCAEPAHAYIYGRRAHPGLADAFVPDLAMMQWFIGRVRAVPAKDCLTLSSATATRDAAVPR